MIRAPEPVATVLLDTVASTADPWSVKCNVSGNVHMRTPCRLMVDKITTVPKSRIGSLIGRLDDEDVLRLNRAVLVFLGLARPVARGERAP